MDNSIIKLKKLLRAIKDKKYYKTKYLPIPYNAHEIKNITTYLLKNGYIERISLNYYQRVFDPDNINSIIEEYKNDRRC